MAELIGRRVLIAGASSGIGFAAAEAFAREGADVALVARGRSGLRAAADRARSHGVAAHVITADLGVREEAEAAVESAARALGGLDVLAWNAAAMVYGQFPDVPPEAFERTMEVTFGGALDTVRAALPHLVRRHDRGHRLDHVQGAARRFQVYAAAKHALRGFLGSLRIELLERKSPVSISMSTP